MVLQEATVITRIYRKKSATLHASACGVFLEQPYAGKLILHMYKPAAQQCKSCSSCQVLPEAGVFSVRVSVAHYIVCFWFGKYHHLESVGVTRLT